MSATKELLTVLACPVCEGKLETQTEELSCSSCARKFPSWIGVPWLMDKADLCRNDWGQRLRFALQSMGHEINALKIEQKLPDLLPLTFERLRGLIQAKTEHLRELEKLMEDLKLPEQPSYELQLAAGTPLPEQLSLFGYHANVLRDWAWGDLENSAALNCVQHVIGETSLGHLAVLGSGPSRLAYDLHRSYPGTKTFVVDINPFYLAVAARMLAGKSLHLYNFPIAPRDLKCTAVKWKCKAPEALKDNFHLMLGDARYPGFAAGQMQTVLTPWLIDVLPVDLRVFACRVNRILASGGHWINFGSLVFHHPQQNRCYSREEVLAIVESSGFTIDYVEQREIPYLHDPSNAQKRNEWVFAFRARKVADVLVPQDKEARIPWLEDTNVPIPSWPELPQQIFIQHSLAVLLSYVTGGRSLEQIAALAAPQLGLSAEQALPLLQRVIGRAYEQRQKARTF